MSVSLPKFKELLDDFQILHAMGPCKSYPWQIVRPSPDTLELTKWLFSRAGIELEDKEGTIRCILSPEIEGLHRYLAIINKTLPKTDVNLWVTLGIYKNLHYPEITALICLEKDGFIQDSAMDDEFRNKVRAYYQRWAI